MPDTTPRPAGSEPTHFDVIIVGAGISGIGSAYHLQEQCPGKSFVVLEAKDTFGGTWETHKYPGIRSDSDLYTFGYRFKPWVGVPVAAGEAILDYMREVIDDNGLDRHIRYGHRITGCAWSSATNTWTVTARRGDGDEVVFTCGFLWMCQGYYDHERPYLPDWPGRDTFKGLLVHAQQWDPATDYAGKRVIVIGSGATAATIVPEMAKTAAKVTMLQRSPTYFLCAPNRNALADRLREIGVDEPTVHRVVRTEVNYELNRLYQRSLAEPDALFDDLKAMIRGYVGEDFQFEPHFIPRYRVMQQRMAFSPDADVFQAVVSGKAEVVTDTIERFTETGILTASGELLEADIIIAATGFRLSVLGDIPFSKDGEPIDWAKTITYRGMMFTDVPNLLWVFGYFRASWTLRVDMLADFVCAMLKHMDAIGAKRVEVALRPEDADMEILPWISDENWNPNYIKRDLHRLPRRGAKPEWEHNQDYWREKEEIPAIRMDAPEFLYDGKRSAPGTDRREPAAAEG